jgi:multicomponent Na+:H+ antiporter subunit G
MEILNWLRFFLGTGLLIMGLLAFCIEIFGIFKFSSVLNRMHAAAVGDTLGLGLSMLGLILLSGFSFTSLKLAMVVAFLWMASPVSSHLISRLEVTTNEHLEKVCNLPSEEWEKYL